MGSFGNLNNVLKIASLAKMSHLTKMGRMMKGNN